MIILKLSENTLKQIGCIYLNSNMIILKSKEIKKIMKVDYDLNSNMIILKF